MMAPKTLFRMSSLLMIGAVLLLVGCSKDDTPVSPGIEPEVMNSIDNFQFQVTDMSNYSGTLQYSWPNTGVMAAVNQACAISAGAATLVLLDDVGVEVYSKDLAENGSFNSNSGASGAWTIRVLLSEATGTLNFRADRATP